MAGRGAGDTRAIITVSCWQTIDRCLTDLTRVLRSDKVGKVLQKDLDKMEKVQACVHSAVDAMCKVVPMQLRLTSVISLWESRDHSSPESSANLVQDLERLGDLFGQAQDVFKGMSSHVQTTSATDS